jgi:hypothetical protein
LKNKNQSPVEKNKSQSGCEKLSTCALVHYDGSKPTGPVFQSGSAENFSIKVWLKNKNRDPVEKLKLKSD